MTKILYTACTHNGVLEHIQITVPPAAWTAFQALFPDDTEFIQGNESKRLDTGSKADKLLKATECPTCHEGYAALLRQHRIECQGEEPAHGFVEDV